MSKSLTDRRVETRINLAVPLKFRPITNPPSGQHIAETINISQRGLCFVTEIPLRLGTQVEVLMAMPSELSGQRPVDVRCIARVMHVKSGWLSGKISIGLHVERYEQITAKERWAS